MSIICTSLLSKKNYENEQNCEKIKHQIKSGKYYIFWGAATIAVMAGQIYVGAGYRSMSESVKDLTEMIEIKIEYGFTQKLHEKNASNTMKIIERNI